MRYSAIIKFFAFVLCAAVIVTALGSGAGLVALTECGLYNRSLSDFYNEDMGYKTEHLARQVAGRYASLNLGGADQRLTTEFFPVSYAYFNLDKIGYVLKDADGKVLQTQTLDSYVPVQQNLTIAAEAGTYIKVLTKEPVEEEDAVTDLPPGLQVHTLPEGNVEISSIYLQFEDGGYEDHEMAEGGDIGYLEVRENGTLCLTSENLSSVGLNEGEILTFITLLDGQRRIAYEAYAPNGLMLGYTRRGAQVTMILPGNAQESVPDSTLPGVTFTRGDFTAYDAIPEDGAHIYSVQLSFGTPEEGDIAGEGISSIDPLGILERQSDGNVKFRSREPWGLDIPTDALITHISFLDQNQTLIYEASRPSGVGTVSYDQNDYFCFYGEIPGLTPEETAPETTEAAEDVTVRGVVLRDTDIYSMPSAGGHTGKVLAAGTEVTILQQEAIGDQSWALVDQGWIDMADIVLEKTGRMVITDVEAAESVRAVATENVNVYNNPGKSENVGHIQKGQTVTVLRQEEYEGHLWGLTDTGWVAMQWLEPETPEPAALDVDPVFETEPIPVETILAETIPAETVPAETVVPETVPAETMPEAVPAETLPEARTAEAPEEDSLAGYAPEEIRTYSYYDSNESQTYEVKYVMAPLPEYTLDLQLAAGADRSEMLWLLLGLAYFLREWLLMILGGSLALLALCVVYLCCAAAHRRGSDVIRAGGLNRIPLDGYIVLAGLGLTGIVLLGYEGTEYFIRNGLRQTGLGVLLGCAYTCAALLAAFCFAFVAQIKTPGGFWWRNSICGRCVLLTVSLCKKCVVFCGSQGWTLGLGTFKWMKRTCLVLLLFGRRTLLWAWDTGKRLCLWAWDLWLRLFRWTRGNLARIFGLLPITWQFLTTGFFLVCFLYVMIRTYKVGYILLGFGLFFAVILYAASAFAILLESAKRMSKGDLDTQVDDRMLIGGFREFAQRLNDLAGVAVIAAQKQLKSERMKTELITNVSHDIKTPLTSIINYVDLLQKPHTEQQQEQYLEVLDRQSQRLKKLIDDLMEMSKASTGNLAVDIERVDAAEAVNQALGEFADKLEKAQLIPVFRQPDDQVCMMADGRLVWRVMSNLLGNAVKYALPGTRIYLDLMEMDGKVIISMKNISREELNVNADELMERFVRGDASRNTEGSGLGLNIAQSLMELQRGQLQILVDGDLFKVTLIFPAA